MSVRVGMLPSERASEPTFLWEGHSGVLLCSPSRLKGRLRWMSRSACQPFNCGTSLELGRLNESSPARDVSARSTAVVAQRNSFQRKGDLEGQIAVTGIVFGAHGRAGERRKQPCANPLSDSVPAQNVILQLHVLMRTLHVTGHETGT